MYYCGIDVAKWSHTVTVIGEADQILVKPLPVTNDQAGMLFLSGLLAPYKDDILVGLESTGHYWLALYDQLTRHGYAVAVINPLQVRAFGKMDIRKRKTDRVDAVRIAQFVRFARPPATDQQLPVLLQLRELTRFRFRLVQQVGDCKRKILCIGSCLPRVSDPVQQRLLAERSTVVGPGRHRRGVRHVRPERVGGRPDEGQPGPVRPREGRRSAAGSELFDRRVVSH